MAGSTSRPTTSLAVTRTVPLASLAWLEAARISALAAAALGVDVIVHAVNPPSYRDWCC